MSEYIANKNRTIVITPAGAWVPGTPTYTDVEASKAKAGGSPILVDKISWNMAACILTSPAGAFVSGSGQMLSSAVKCKCDGKTVMRQLDSGSCSGTFQPPGAPPPPPIPCSCTFQIVNAGQLKDKAN